MNSFSFRFIALIFLFLTEASFAKGVALTAGSFFATRDFKDINWNAPAFTNPNETRPQHLVRAVRRAVSAVPEGLLLTTGTERALIHLSLLPTLTGGIVVDREPLVIAYLYAAMALIRVSQDKSECLHLRTRSSHDEWVKRAQALPAGKLREALESPLVFKYWEQRVRGVDSESTFQYFHKAPTSAEDHFADANYLFSDVLFNRLKELIEQERILLLEADFSQPEAVRKLGLLLDSLEEKIAVFDSSNLTESSYLQGQGVWSLVEQLRSQLIPEGFLMTTAMANRCHASWGPSDWEYFGWRFDKLVTPAGKALFLKGFSPVLKSYGFLGDALEIPIKNIRSAHRSFRLLGASFWTGLWTKVFETCSGILSNSTAILTTGK